MNAKKDRTMFVSTCAIKWKAPNNLGAHEFYVLFF